MDDENYDVTKAAEEQRVQRREDNIMNKSEANELRNLEWWKKRKLWRCSESLYARWKPHPKT